MTLFFSSKTFQPANHGPAKFANYLFQFCSTRNRYQIKFFVEDVTDTSPETIFHVTASYFRILRPFSEILRNFTYYRSLVKYLPRRENPIIIFNNCIHSLYTNYILGPKIPVIGFINDNENIRTSLSTFELDKKWLFRYVMRFIEKKAAKKCTKVIVCSEALRTQVAKNYKIPNSKIYTLYQGVDLDKFAFRKHHDVLKNKEFINIVFIKSDYQRGGLYILRSAIALLHHINFTLTIAGPWPIEEKRIIKEFEHVRNCKTNFLGPINESNVIALLHQHDIFCVPSLREALGVANIEALACGIPVVTSSSLGIPEVLDQGKNGWVSQPGDSIDLAKQLQLCINNDSIRYNKSSVGRKFVERNFDINKNLNAFLTMLELELNPGSI